MITQKDVDIFGAVFEFYKKYHSAPDWTGLINEADELSAKYKSRFLDQIILICVDDIDRRYMASINKPWKSDPLEEVYNRLQRNRGMKKHELTGRNETAGQNGRKTAERC